MTRRKKLASSFDQSTNSPPGMLLFVAAKETFSPHDEFKPKDETQKRLSYYRERARVKRDIGGPKERRKEGKQQIVVTRKANTLVRAIRELSPFIRIYAGE